MNKKFIEALAGRLGLNAEELAQVIASEEEATMELPQGKFFSDEDLETLKSEHGKTRYEAGKTAGYEISLKDLSKASGIETAKTGEDFVKAYQAKVLEEAKIEPEQKVKDLTASLEKLQQTVTEKENAYRDLEQNVQKERTKYQFQSELPDLPETLGLSKEEATSLFFIQHEINEDGTISRNGKVLKNHLEQPLDLKSAREAFISEKGWNKPAPAGRGGGAQGGQGGKTKFTSIDEFESSLKEKGINPLSAEAQALLQEAAKDSPELLD